MNEKRKSIIALKIGVVALSVMLALSIIILSGFMGVGCTRRPLRGRDF